MVEPATGLDVLDQPAAPAAFLTYAIEHIGQRYVTRLRKKKSYSAPFTRGEKAAAGIAVYH